MIAVGVSIDLSSLPAELLPDFVSALPAARAKRILDSIKASSFPHLAKNEDRMRTELELRAMADPSYIDRLRVKKDKNDG